MTEIVVFCQQAKEEAELSDQVEPGLSTPELTSAASSSDEPGNLFVLGFFFYLPLLPPQLCFFHIQISKTSVAANLRCLFVACAVSIFLLNYVAILFAGPKSLLRKHVKIYRNVTPVCFTVSFFICIEDIAIYVFSGYGVRPGKLNQ